jgi:hypothetical protein
MAPGETTLLEAALRRDRLVVVAAPVSVIAVAWIWIVLGAGTGMSAVAMTQMARMPDMGMMMERAMWTSGYAALIFVMCPEPFHGALRQPRPIREAGVGSRGEAGIRNRVEQLDTAERYGKMRDRPPKRRSGTPLAQNAAEGQGLPDSVPFLYISLDDTQRRSANPCSHRDAGLRALRDGLQQAGEARFLPRFLLLLGELAACLGKADEIALGLETVDEALSRCSRSPRCETRLRSPVRAAPVYRIRRVRNASFATRPRQDGDPERLPARSRPVDARLR